MNSLNSQQTVDWSFGFNKPVFIPDFTVSDVDWAGYGYNTSGIGMPHESFQDEVILAGQRGGNAIATTATGGSGITDLGGGQLVAGPYTAGVNGNVGPTDAAGTVSLTTVGPVTSFNMQYSNGPDDAAADALDGSPPAPIPANSAGVSNNHAVAISNFTVCAGNLRFGDLVWADIDGDGIQDAGEPGLPGVLVTISDPQGNVIETQTTAADGSYEFEQFPGFTWVVSIDAPTGYSATYDRDGGDLTSTAINPTTNEFDIDFGLQPDPGTISGSVFTDRNDNGALDATQQEVPLPGVTIELSGQDLAGNPVTGSTTTAADGTYTFTGVPAGTYEVAETQPAVGFADGQDTPGTNAVADGNDQHEVTLGQLESSIGNDFAEIPTSSLSGTVYEDGNDNAAIDSGEDGIAGVTINVDGTDVFGNVVSFVTTTGSDGTYLVPRLISGTYTITEATQPAPFADGQESVGSSGGTVGQDTFTSVPLGFDDTATDYDFGEIPVSSISGRVAGEVGDPIGGVAITLDGVDDLGAAVSASTTTAADGTYSFIDLRPGTYSVTETQPPAYGDDTDSVGTIDGVSVGTLGNDVLSDIVISVGDNGIDYDFNETLSSIAGSVVDDGGNPIAGVTIDLSGTDVYGNAVTASTTTASDGTYSFDDLVGGTYTITEAQPAGYGDGGETAGTSGGVDSTNDTISAIVLTGGADATGYDFDETRSSIAGLVFVDPDNDGLFTGADTPEPGVTITLTGTDIFGASVTASTTTAPDGTYSFDGLLEGTYQIDETQPAGLVDGIDTVGSLGGVDSVNDRFSAIAVGAGVDGTGYNFAELPPAGVTGSVTDSNGDPIGGVTIALAGTSTFGTSINQTTTTAADGTYSFFDLPPGTYAVTETQPVGYGDGPDAVGTVAGSAVGTLGNDVITNIVLGTDSIGVNYDFTETYASIAGSVVDDDGTGIAGVSITLTGTDNAGSGVSLSTTTASDGSYSFDELLGGTYTIAESQPVAYGDGGESAGTSGGDDSVDDTISAIVLAPGVDATSYDFDETRGSIAGAVFEDTNNNGTQDSGEPAIGGATIELTGTDVNGTAVSVSTTTAVDGTYSFDDLLAGTYIVNETQPSGYLDGLDATGSSGGDASVTDEFSAIALAGGVDATGYLFGEILPSSISGTVFVDDNDNGTQNAGDAGIAGVTVGLSGTDDLGAAVTASTTTASDGTYSFTGLRPGTYTVTETHPTAYLDGTDTPGTAGGDASVNDAITSITLPTNTTATGYDFAELEGASIAGTVVDDGGNPIESVTIELTGTDDLGTSVTATTTTAADGTYTFAGLRPGTYTVTETQPTAYGDGGETAGSEGGDDTSVNDQISAIALPAATDATGYDFDETRGSIAGVVYEDTNNNGVLDGSESGIAGASVRLTGVDSSGALIDVTATTLADGPYLFPSLLAGTYEVTETQPTTHLDGIETPGTAGGAATTNDQIASIVLAGGVDATSNNFGELLPSSITGSVVDDAGTGIGGVLIELTGTDDSGDPVTATATTATNGTYSFTGLRPGTYSVTETQPVLYLDGGETAGTVGGNDLTDDTITAITLASDTHALGYDFDEIRASSIAGTVVDDTGNGIADVDITLTGTDDLGAPVSLSATTAVDGTYGFVGLRPGTYTVAESQPTAYGDGGETAGSEGGDDSTDDAISAIALAAHTDATGYDFDETRGSIAGLVYEDTNNNGVRDAGEPAISGASVVLTGTDVLGNPVSVNGTTLATGVVQFNGLLAGDYALAEAQPAGYLDGLDAAGTAGGVVVDDDISSIALTGGTAATGYTFGEIFPSSISGTVFDDDNGNGSMQSGEAGIAGVTVELTGTDDLGNTVNLTTTTAADGTYSFTGLRPGTYTVTETHPTAYLDGIDSAGSSGGDASVNDIVSSISLATDTDATGYDFAEIEASSIAGTVVEDAGTGITNVTIELTGTDDLGNTVNLTTTTAADGTYSFTGLRPGTYTVTETQPTVYGDGGEVAGTAGGVVSNDQVAAIALPANTSATGYDFDEIRGSITGQVYEDTNGSGAHNGAEPGITGVTIELTGTDDLGNTVNLTTTTAADGTYSFGGLLAGIYTVAETQPTAYLDAQETIGSAGGTNTTNDEIDLTLTAANNATGYDFGEVQPATITGTVYIDADNSGTQNGTEVGIDAVTVALTGTDDLGATVSASTTTAADGTYSFTGLRPGTYTVTETQPTALGDGTDSVGSAGGTLGNDVITGVVLESAEDATGYDFGELEGASISGTVVDDAGDGIANTTLTLSGTDDLGATVSASTTSAADGTYSFAGLRPGTYTVTETQPTGYGDGGETAGTAGGSVTNDVISTITVGSGQAATGYDFDETRSSLGGSVYLDANGNGVRDAGDTGLAGVPVELTGTDDLGGAVTLSTVTGADGSFLFNDLISGTYVVTETAQPTGLVDGLEAAGTSGGIAGNTVATNDTITAIALAAGVDATGYLFGEWDTSTIGGSVVDELGNPIPGVTLTLAGTEDDGGTVTLTAVTGPTGAYTFTGLEPGTYSVTETQPVAYGDGGETVGTIGGSAVGATTDDVTSNIVLGPNESGVNYDFDETLGSISGTVFEDTNGNGTLETEPGIAAVTVTLTGADANGATVNATTTTAADGSYTFDDLVGGTYAISQTQPAGYLDGAETIGSAGGSSATNDVITAITTTGGADETGYDFGEIDAASVSGSVVDDAGNPIVGVTLTLTGTDDLGTTVNLTDTTDVTGVYSFDGLRPGTYTVNETQPISYGDGGETAGPTGGTVTDDQISTIVLGPDTDATNNDFDEIRSSVSGRVFEDLDSSGSPDTGEPGINGVTIALTGTDDLGNLISATTTTSGDGDFSFTGLLSGTYTITESHPTAYADGDETVGSAGGNAALQNDVVSGILIGGGTTETGYFFGEVTPVSISGTVYIDSDNDGSATGETGIGNVTIALSGLDDRGVAVNQTTTTAGDGTYSFDNLRPGTYNVTETQPAGFLDGIDSVGSADGIPAGTVGPDQITTISLTSGQTGVGYDFGELNPSSISGDVVDDLARPIAGVDILLTGTDDLGATVSAATTTAADGTYSFDNLRPGTYTVTEAQPLAYGDGGETPGTSSGTATNDVIGGISLEAGTGATGYDFDETTAEISGVVFADLDGDTVPSAGDTDLSGVALALSGADMNGQPVTATTTTAADGTYEFAGLLAGTYTVTETQPAGFIDGIDTAGTIGGTTTGAADNAAGGDEIAGITLTAGSASIGNNFSEVETGSISGAVVDDSADGIGDVTITLSGTDLFGQPVSATTLTASNGTYSFSGLAPGTYTVTETQPVAYGDGGETVGSVNGSPVGSSTDDEIAAIVLTSGQDGVGYDFDETTMAISGAVVVDDNNNGVADLGEAPIGGVTLHLAGTDVLGNGVIATTTTAADGSYLFEGLLAGTYTVTETQPAGFLDGAETAGTAGGVVGADSISAIVLNAGPDASGYDFGELESASLAGSVVDDLGLPIEGVTITLTGTDDLGNSVTTTTTTGADGSYIFEGLRPGTYTITETQPPAYGDGGETIGVIDGVATGSQADDQILVIQVMSGDVGTGYDFDETTGSLSGSVVHTTDSGDAPISGVTVSLTGTDVNGDPVSDSTTTVADGTYVFNGLLAGGYTVTETQPVDFADGPERVGTAGGDATVNDVIATIALGAGVNATGYDFTETGTALSGRVLLDRTGDGVPDPTDDLDLSGITIELIDPDGSVVATTTTAADGTYVIGGLLAGDYTVRQTQPAPWGSISPNDLSITLPTNGLSNVDFVEEAGSISGTVFADSDTNGLDDENTPTSGVVVTLSDGTGVIATTTTDDDGDYTFIGLPAGDYTVAVEAVDDTAFTIRDAGSDDGVDSDVDPATGTVTVPLDPGADVTNVDAGTVEIEQDLAIDITTEATNVNVGDEVTFNTVVTNSGNTTVAGGVTVTIPLPTNTTFVSAAGEGWSISVDDGVLTATRPGTLAPGEVTPLISFTVETTEVGSVNATGQVVSSSGLVETTTSNNVSSVPVTVTATTTTNIPNLAYTGGSALMLLLIAGALIASGRTLMMIGNTGRKED